MLRTFHHSCARVMRRVTLKHTWKHHISTTDILTQLDLLPIEYYYHSRLLRWLGHVSRMPMNRMPRKMITAWVAKPRRSGGQLFNWGRTVKKALNANNIPTDFSTWCELASDRMEWRNLTQHKKQTKSNLTECKSTSRKRKPLTLMSLGLKKKSRQ